VRFEPGDTLVLATDGFFEWANAAGEQYGTRRLEAFVAAHAHEPPAELVAKLHASVIAHASGSAQPDDLTVVVIKRSGSARPTSPGSLPRGTSSEGMNA
jgi:serine phosphatase RsbU (regulator of sigma subunit)